MSQKLDKQRNVREQLLTFRTNFSSVEPMNFLRCRYRSFGFWEKETPLIGEASSWDKTMKKVWVLKLAPDFENASSDFSVSTGEETKN